MTTNNLEAEADYSNVPCATINPDRQNCRNNCDEGLSGDDLKDLCGTGSFTLTQFCTGSDCSVMKRSRLVVNYPSLTKKLWPWVQTGPFSEIFTEPYWEIQIWRLQ